MCVRMIDMFCQTHQTIKKNFFLTQPLSKKNFSFFHPILVSGAILCSGSRVWEIFYESIDFKTFRYKSRACLCWNQYRKGKCNNGKMNEFVKGYIPTMEGYKLVGQQMFFSFLQLQYFKKQFLKLPPQIRAQLDWTYEFPHRTEPDTQICQTGPTGLNPDLYFTYQITEFQ